jgi:proline iminopeptidase
MISFDIGGIRLVPDGAHRCEGPNALVIHGGPGSYHSGFKPGYAADARDATRLFRPPRPGRSARDGDPARWTLDENVEDMEVLRRHLGLWPIVSISTSSGGMVGTVLAAHSPDAVSHLILVATAAHGGFIRRAREILAERGRRNSSRSRPRSGTAGSAARTMCSTSTP